MEKKIIHISEKERLDADYNLKSWLDILYAEEERDYDKIYEIEDLLNKLSSNSIDKDVWAKIQEYVIAREMIRDKTCLEEEPKTIYQVCYDRDVDYFIPKSYGRPESVVVCYETDSEYDAQCYIGEMYHLGDYSNYYIRVKKEDV